MVRPRIPCCLLLALLLPALLSGQTSSLSLAGDVHPWHPPADAPERGLKFTENKGQWEPPISYAADLGGINRLYLERDRFTFWLFDPEQSADLHDNMLARPGQDEVFNLSGHAYRVNFVGATTTGFSTQGKSEKSANYFLGNDPARWTSSVFSFERVVYEELYAGIQLAAYSEAGNFKYDFIVQPHADPDQIVLRYEAVDSLFLEAGNLTLLTNVGPIRELKPFAFQVKAGKKVAVPCDYQLKNNQVSFAFPAGYDVSLPLTIDPTVIGATLAGSDVSRAFGHSATFDNGGNIYTAGISFGVGYPTTMGAFAEMYTGGLVDVAISKFNADGSDLLYSTYIGGTDREYPYSTVVDDNGQLSFLGSTLSRNYPTTENAFQDNYRGNSDIIVTKLRADGAMLAGSTLLGGSDADGINNSPFSSGGADSYRGEIILDNSGNVYIATCSQSGNFPVTANAPQQTIDEGGQISLAQDGIVAKLNSDLSTLFWSTYLGGDGIDLCSGLRVTDNNEVYVTGFAGGADFPMAPGGLQPTWPGGRENAFVVKLAADGSRVLNGTFWGTAGEEKSYFIDVDEVGQVHIYGLSTGDMPITPGTWFANPGSNQFVSAFSADLSTLVYSTVIGAPGSTRNDFIPVAFMVDKCNGIYLSGYYATAGLPLSDDFVYGNDDSFYLAVLEPNATGLIFGSYYGDANHVDGGTSRFDKGGVVYQGVCSCVFDNRVLNVTNNAWETFQDTDCDVGVFKIDFDVEVVTAAGVASPTTSGCLPLTLDFTYSGRDAETVSWDFGNGDTDTGRAVNYTFTEAGTYTVTQVAASPTACNLSDTFRLEIVVLDGNSSRTERTFCAGADIAFLDASVPGATYHWQDGSTAATYQPTENGTYWVDVSVDGCVRRDSFVLAPPSDLFVDLGEAQLTVCDEPAVDFDVSHPAAASYRWQDGTSGPTYSIGTAGTYAVTITDDFGCAVTDAVTVNFSTTVPVSLGPDLSLCEGTSDTLEVPAAGVSHHWQDGSTSPAMAIDQPGTYWVELNNGGCRSRDSLEATFIPQPNASISASATICFDQNDGFISATEVSGGADFTFRWSDGAAGPERTGLSDGVYRLSISNAFGCSTEFIHSITRDTPIEYETIVLANPCSPEEGGRVTTSPVSGGQPPYRYAIDDSPFADATVFGGLRGGDYAIRVRDAAGCVVSRPVTVLEPPIVVLDAGVDRLIDLADSTYLQGSVSSTDNLRWFWSPAAGVSAPFRLGTFARPLAGETTFYLSAMDTITGCRYTDSLTVRVDRARKVYLPSAFSPNDDGVNDRLFPQADASVTTVNAFHLYNRWGGLVYAANDFPPNAPEFGWDGRQREVPLQTQLFLYTIEVTFIDGVSKSFSGEVLLIR